MQTATRKEAGMWENKEPARDTSLCCFYTHTQQRISQMGLHLTLDMPPTWQTGMERWECVPVKARPEEEERKGADVGVWWMTDNALIGRDRCNGLWSGRPQETVRETICLSAWNSLSSSSLSALTASHYCAHTLRERGANVLFQRRRYINSWSPICHNN